MFFLVFVLFLDCFFNMHLCAKLQPYSSNKFKSEEWDVNNIQYSPVVRCVYARHRAEM